MDDILFRRFVQLRKYLGDESFCLRDVLLGEQFLEFLDRFLKLHLDLKVTGMLPFVYAVAF